MSTHALCDCEYDSEDDEINIINIINDQDEEEVVEQEVKKEEVKKEEEQEVKKEEEQEVKKEEEQEVKKQEEQEVKKEEEQEVKKEEEQEVKKQEVKEHKNYNKNVEKVNLVIKEETETETEYSELKRKIIFKLDLGKMYPIMACNLVGAICIVMEQIEALELPNEEKRKLVQTILMKLEVAQGDDSRRFIIDNNMLNNIIETIINCTRNKYEINSSRSRVNRFFNKLKTFKFDFDFESLSRKCKK